MEQRLADPIILEPGAIVDEVTLGIPVTVKNLDTGKTRIYTIVSPEELDEVDNAASEESPWAARCWAKKPVIRWKSKAPTASSKWKSCKSAISALRVLVKHDRGS
jgi:hypothetical protein